MKHGLFVVLANLVFVAMMFPYSPPITGASTQPLAPFLCLLLVVASIAYRLLAGTVAKNFFLYVFLFLVFIVIQIIKIEEYPWDTYVVLKYLTAFIFFWFGATWLHNISFRLIFLILFAWVLAGTIQIFMPEMFLSIVSTQQVSGTRGSMGLAPEPSLFAFQMGLFFLLLVYKKARNEIGRVQYYLSIILVLYGLILSLSATAGIIFFIVVLIVSSEFAPKKPRHYVSALLVSVVVFGGLAQVIPGTRIESSLNLFETVKNLSDRSLNTRLFHNFMGVNVFLEGKTFGYSSDAFSKQGIDMFDNEPAVMRTIYSRMDPNSNGKIHSLFASFAIDFGILSGIVIIFLIAQAFRNCLSTQVWYKAALITSLLFLFFLLPVPVGSPLYFSMLGIYSKTNRREL